MAVQAPNIAGIWLSAARPKTLPAALAPVITAYSLCIQYGTYSSAAAFRCLAFALLIQIGTNFANDYFDAKKGADTVDRKGPKRAVASGLISPALMMIAAAVALLLALFAGFSMVQYVGYEIIPIGLVCILLAIAYTGGPFPIAYKGLGDIFVFLFFGLVAVMLSAYVITSGTVLWSAFWAGCGCGMYATNILVVNNYRDRETDMKANKRTSTVRFGHLFSLRQYAICAIAAPLTALPLLISGIHWSSLFILLLILPGLRYTIDLRSAGAHTCNRLLGQSAQLLLAYALIIFAGTCLSLWQ